MIHNTIVPPEGSMDPPTPIIRDPKKKGPPPSQDPISGACGTVQFMQASSGRRGGLKTYIEDGNRAGDFIDNKTGAAIKLAVVELLRDMDVRWDSTYLMIDRVLYLRPVRFLLCHLERR